MKFREIFTRLRNVNEQVPKPLRLPTIEEVSNIEDRLKLKLPVDFKTYLLNISDIVYGTIEPVNATDPDYYTYIDEVFNNFANLGLSPDKNYYPICEDNGDFYCMDDDGTIFFISHNGVSNDKWQTLGEWIEHVWLLS